MDLHARYQKTLKEQGYSADEAQIRAIGSLQRIAGELVDGPAADSWGMQLRRLVGARPASSIRGIYLWGDVGRGKTFMMDLFFDNLPLDEKLRFHFHRLMYRVHTRLKELDHHQDPLDIVAEDLSRQARVICFDEFFVSDIADAMILGKLFKALFDRGVTLVATSNVPPDELYADGLQRQQFLPAIKLLKQRTEVLQIDGDTDYRLRILERAEIYHTPLDEPSRKHLARCFSDIAPDAGTHGQTMEVLGRHLNTIRRADGIVWFSFKELCDGPRSQDDYIEIARCFQTVILSGVPILDEFKENQARRFIALVDEFYDRRVKLIISAEVSLENVYMGTHLTHEFKRTRSRLQEMQSLDYLATAHVP